MKLVLWLLIVGSVTFCIRRKGLPVNLAFPCYTIVTVHHQAPVHWSSCYSVMVPCYRVVMSKYFCCRNCWCVIDQWAGWKLCCTFKMVPRWLWHASIICATSISLICQVGGLTFTAVLCWSKFCCSYVEKKRFCVADFAVLLSANIHPELEEHHAYPTNLEFKR